MKLTEHATRALAKGQIWKTLAADFEILALNQDFIHYKVTRRFGGRHVSAQVSGLGAMADYLQRHDARLVSSSRN